jgi:5-formyltetrahydrofolate cyclo-ligase
LRAEIRARLAARPLAYFSAQGTAAGALIRGSFIWKQYETVLLFLSAGREIDTSPILKSALEGGKRVFAPRLAGEGMVFCRVPSAAGPWEEGLFGIPEPPPPGDGAVLSAADFPALVFVPGLAFDAGGGRLGRGGGYYDRFLAGLEAAGRPFRAAGLCTGCQLVPEVPADGWDKKVDCLCTGEDIFNARSFPAAP